MAAVLKKLVPDDFSGRFSAWWNGRDYVPGGEQADDVESVEAIEPANDDKKKKTPKTSDDSADAFPKASPGASRVAALETLWGDGRFSPASTELYSRITEGMSSLEKGADARFGMVNGDPALMAHFMGVSGACPIVAEWRKPCAERFSLQYPEFEVIKGDLDRPSFEPGSLDLLASFNAFIFSDHKSGLAVRALRSLAPGAQWVVIDLVRGTAHGSLAPAFASSWAEPQLCEGEEIVEVCEAAGFELSSDEDDVSGDVVQASRSAFEKFGQDVEGMLSGRLGSVNKQVFVRELAWEAESWKWRQRALAADLIHAKVWKFRKPNA